MNIVGEIFGEVCKTLFPIPEELYFGNPHSTVAICTLSNINLLKKISNSNLMKDIFVVGRLLSENKGIDEVIRFVNSNSKVNTIILCGDDVIGHQPGMAILALHKHGIDEDHKIINSSSPDPILTVQRNEISKFQKQIKIINKIGLTDFNEISKLVLSIKS